MTFHHFSFVLLITFTISVSLQQNVHAQILTKDKDVSQSTYVDSDMWNNFKLNKNVTGIETSKTDKLWAWQTTRPKQNEPQIFTQDQNSVNDINNLQSTSLPSGFTGSPSELYEIKKQFSSYKPQTTHIKRGKIYLRKNLQKPKEWKRTLETNSANP